jgi:hypothetical protein
MNETQPGRRWTDRFSAEGHLAFEVLLERLKLVEQAVAHEADLRELSFSAHDRLHQVFQRAFEEYQASIADKLHDLNRLRAEVLEDRGLFITREQSDARSEHTEARFRSIEKVIWMGTGGMGVAFTLLQLLLHFAFHR